MTLEERRRERKARRSHVALENEPELRLPAAAATPDGSGCRWLGKPGEQLPGCKCKGRPTVYQCTHPEALQPQTLLARPDGCQLKAAREAGLAMCDSCPLFAAIRTRPSISWAVGVTASRRTVDTLAACLESIEAAGLPAPIVFADGADTETHGATAVVRATPAGALQNFYAAAAELVMRSPDAAHVMLQDDTTVPAGLAAYLEAEPWPADACLVKLFTTELAARHFEADAAGWLEIPKGLEMKGAQAYIFPPGRLDQFVRSSHAISQRRQAERSSEAIDNVVARWAASRDGRQYFHAPSLAEHHGTSCSTLGHQFGRAWNYPGDDFDALELHRARRPRVCAVLVTQPHRHDLALVAVDSFMRQTYPDRVLLIVTELAATGEASSLLEAWSRANNNGHRPPRMHELIVSAGLPLGAIRNQAIEQAAELAPLCIQWDDDDYSAPDRIARQVDAWQPGHAVVLTAQLRSDLRQGQAKAWSNPQGIEGTILHETATPHRYPPLPKAEDTQFARAFREAGRLIAMDNDPAAYFRFFHGANTWDRKHIMRGAPVTDSQAEAIDNVRLLYNLHPLDRWRIQLPKMHGWSSAPFCQLLLELLQYQHGQGLVGDVLDIGVHHGRVTLGLAAQLLQLNQHAGRPPDEGPLVHAVDLWPNAHHRAQFEHHRHVVDPGDQLPLQIDRRDSLELPAAAADRRYTLAHVDGCHDLAHAASDLAHAVRCLDPRGLLVVDDVHNPAHPEVAPAFWSIAEAEGLLPVATCSNRWLCALDEESRGRYFKQARETAQARRLEMKAPKFRGRPLLVIQ